jgi:DNA-binding NtrC family response regulator
MPVVCDESAPLLIGHSPETARVRESVDKCGHSRWPVLILGETGTGKEVVAKSIHRAGQGGPFVVIDCSSMVGPLMESELFGHARGSFTGASQDKLGLLEAANGGTAFLDEIGELPLDVQAKLLRVLQEKEFRPVGAVKQRHSDFRIIAATNRHLAKEVENGAFRNDLYYRLKVLTVRLAPLRDRTSDIPLLIKHFLARYGSSHIVTAEAMDILLDYPWPGNVRELEHCLQQMVAVSSGFLLQVADLPSQVQNFRLAHVDRSVAAAFGESGVHFATPLPYQQEILSLHEVEKRTILRAIEYTKGDRTLAATLLGIGRTTLYRKLKEYGLPE